jgi:hypothetical protein
LFLGVNTTRSGSSNADGACGVLSPVGTPVAAPADDVVDVAGGGVGRTISVLRLYLANWNRYSRGHPGWFSPTHDDGIHLTGAGAVGLVKLVRRYIPRAADGPRSTTGSQIALDFMTRPRRPRRARRSARTSAGKTRAG